MEDPKMSVPAPPIPPEYLGRSLVQFGGPVSVASGATSGAITFGQAFPDTYYSVNIDWVSGQNPSFGTRDKTVNSAIIVYTTQITSASAFRWSAWRLV